MNGRIKLSGPLKSYLNWPITLSVLMIIMNIAVYFINVRAGTLVSFFVAAYIAIVVILYFHNRPIILNELITFATQYGQIQKNLMRDFAIPFAVLDADGKVMWLNKSFSKLTGKDKKYHKSITNVMSEITQDILPGEEDEIKEVEISYGSQNFRVKLQRINIDGLLQNSKLVDVEEVRDNCLIGLYMYDVTELNEYIRKNEEEKLVSGLLYLDNYEEATDSVEEVRRSLLTALIERKITKYFSAVDGVVKRLEKDKYFLVMRRGSMEQLKEQKFNILEDIKNVNIGNEMSVTISMGLGAHADTYAQTAEYARVAIELALGRGGDQVVIKDGDQISYYGGKSQMVEKTTRVKARVKAHALKEFMSQKDNVVVMGHKITDVDTFGAAIGIYRAAKTLNKKAYIVINNATSSIRPLMDEFINNPDYDPHMFVNSHEAKDITDDNTVLVVVDTNRPSYSECEELLSMTKTIVVLDHHRQSSEVIKNAVLSYIEPYASSACEMVAEVLQYFADGIRIRNIEADSIYAGIMIDTNNFMTKTGVRTFEAAAFLRRCGADVTRVRKLFRENAEDYRARGEAIRNAELFRKCYAISVCPAEGLESPTVVGAQAANELLNIVGVKASFVMTDYKDMIYISARAIDEVNVQIIMERMGGGGHLNIAGSQLKGYTVREAIDYLKQTLQEMIDGGDI
ncbi:DHH family phosphoesterase [Ruminococcus gauvreauii]|uniref:Cyclic-di-AMP phosphodiesterase n=1 Tax=Ruminococcus gauvreauii TaxID=438033 RepID=A0ABY5VC34_9FIRM|nr:DHH family phosphoesterase [Ruminococcus gauvreauii]UWP58066.1 DHH family phosphoesterase [Ruminococcus gauvreauii]